MDDAGAMRRRQALPSGQELVDDFRRRTRAQAQPLAEGRPFDQLHRHEHGRAEGAHVVDGNDVGMGQLREGLCFAQKPLRRLCFFVAM
jgi:hypothetical protein